VRQEKKLTSSCGCYHSGLFNGSLEQTKGLGALSQQPMTHMKGKGKVYTNISVDRIDSSIHYKKGNLQLVCYMFNIWKGKLSNEEFKNWVYLAGEHSFSSKTNHSVHYNVR